MLSITSNKDTNLSKMEEGVIVAESEADLVVIQVRIPDIKAEKCLQFSREERVWDVKQQILAAMPKVRSSEIFLVYKLCGPECPKLSKQGVIETLISILSYKNSY